LGQKIGSTIAILYFLNFRQVGNNQRTKQIPFHKYALLPCRGISAPYIPALLSNRHIEKALTSSRVFQSDGIWGIPPHLRERGKLISGDNDVADQLRRHLAEGGKWELLFTPIQGVSVVKIPPTKARPARLAVTINPGGQNSPRKKRGLTIASEDIRQAYLAALTHPDLSLLLGAVQVANNRTKSIAHLPAAGILHTSVVADIDPNFEERSPPAVGPAPGDDFVVAERGSLSARSQGVIRVSAKAVLVRNAAGRDIWIPKMALASDCKPPAAPQDTPWVFSVQAWFAKKPDFRAWWQGAA